MVQLLHYWRGYRRMRRLDGVPVVLGGCERSGTTLLHSMVSALPAVHAVPDETWALCYARQAGFPGDRPVRLHRLWRYLGEGEVKAGAARWSEKSPANIFYFDEIREALGAVRLIQVVRDGRDVVTSIHPSRPERPWVPPKRWKEAVEAGLRQRGRDDVLTLRYRDLVLDPEGSMRIICEFLGEPHGTEAEAWWRHAQVRRSENLVGASVGRPHPDSVGKFRRPGFERREPVERLMADPEAVQLLKEYGFLD